MKVAHFVTATVDSNLFHKTEVTGLQSVGGELGQHHTYIKTSPQEQNFLKLR